MTLTKTWRLVPGVILLGLQAGLVAAQTTTTYHLHKEASSTSGWFQLTTATPDGTSLAIQSSDLRNQPIGQYGIKKFNTQASVPNLAGNILSGSTVSFTVWMRKTTSAGIIRPWGRVRLNDTLGPALCEASAGGNLTTTLASYTFSCTTTATIAMTTTDRFFVNIGADVTTAAGDNTVLAELDVEGTANGNYDSRITVPLPVPLPTISNVNPSSAGVGQAVTISAANFTAGALGVSFNGIAATPGFGNDLAFSTTVPSGATSGPLSITVGGVASNTLPFTVLPKIDSLAANTTLNGQTVTIAGTSFGTTQGSSTVTFNGVTATPTSWNATTIVVPVPAAATTGNIVVTVGGVPSAGSPFTIKPLIAILTPDYGQIGTLVTITGAHFGGAQGSSSVTFSGIPATPFSWSSTSVTVQVPSGATTGTVFVTVNTVSSASSLFTIMPPPPPPSGRYRLVDGVCYWDSNDGGPNQCNPQSGRYKLNPAGECYWNPNDSGENECTPPPSPDNWHNLNFVIRELETGQGICGVTVQIYTDFGNGTTRTTDCSGFANFGVQSSTIEYLVYDGTHFSETGTANVLSNDVTTYRTLTKQTANNGDPEDGPDDPPESDSEPTTIYVPAVDGQTQGFSGAASSTVTLKPNQKHTFYVQILDITGNPIPNVIARLYWAITPSSDHIHTTAGAPNSAFFKTDSQSACYTTGGPGHNACVVSIQATDISADLDLIAQRDFGVGPISHGYAHSGVHQDLGGFIDRLENYAAGKDWTLYGEDTAGHQGGNHWCEMSFCSGLNTMFTEYNARYNLPLWINDISLKRGGRYDVNWNPQQHSGSHLKPWKDPHIFHMDGRDADVRTVGTGAIPDDAKIRNWILGKSILIFHHRAYFHDAAHPPLHLHIYGW